MAKMMWKYTSGFDPAEFSTSLALTDDASLKEDEKDLFLAFACSAASKTLTLGLEDGQFMIIANVGASNAVTVKNVKDDTGTSVAAGAVYLVIASTTADASKMYLLNYVAEG